MEDRFKDLATIWDSNPNRVKGAFTFVNKVKEFLPKDISNFDVLDYGCGTGLVSFGFANEVKSIKGLDNSDAMVRIYNEKSSKVNIKNIKSSIHNINNEELEKNIYDLVITNMTMHHIKKIDKFIEKLTYSLKNGGYLCIADLVTEDGTFHSDNRGVEHFGFDITKVEEYFLKKGLKNIKFGLLENINKPNKNYEVFYIIGQKI